MTARTVPTGGPVSGRDGSVFEVRQSCRLQSVSKLCVALVLDLAKVCPERTENYAACSGLVRLQIRMQGSKPSAALRPPYYVPNIEMLLLLPYDLVPNAGRQQGLSHRRYSGSTGDETVTVPIT
jgi:hypothetical protein